MAETPGMMIELTYHQPKWAVGFVGSGWCVDRISLKLCSVTCSGSGSRSARQRRDLVERRAESM